MNIVYVLYSCDTWLHHTGNLLPICFFFLFDFTYTILVTKLFERCVFIFLVSILFWACVLHDTDTAANSNSTVVNTCVIVIQNCLSIKYAHNNAIRAIMAQYKYAHVLVRYKTWVHRTHAYNTWELFNVRLICTQLLLILCRIIYLFGSLIICYVFYSRNESDNRCEKKNYSHLNI